ncbi:MAG: hypothetical protein ACK4NY_15150 [Spirosomataceae bacterium]
MKENKYAKMSLEELKATEKKMKVAISAFIGMLIVLAISVAYLTLRDGFSVFLVLPFTLIPILMANVMGMKKIQEEIKSRG